MVKFALGVNMSEGNPHRSQEGSCKQVEDIITNLQRTGVLTAATEDLVVLDLSAVESLPGLLGSTVPEGLPDASLERIPELLRSLAGEPPSETLSDSLDPKRFVVLRRGVLAAVVAAVLGGALKLSDPQLDPILAAAISAEAALVINLLAAYVTGLLPRRQAEHLVPLDYAVLAALESGELTAIELRNRVSKAVRISEVEDSLVTLRAQGLVECQLHQVLQSFVWRRVKY